MIAALTLAAFANPPSRAIVWGGGPTPEDGAAWMARWRQESPDYADLLTLAPGWPQLVESRTVPGLKPGFHVVLLGICPAGDEGPALSLLKAIHPGAYARDVAADPPPDACPSPREGAAVLRREAIERGRSSAAVVAFSVRIPEVEGGESAQGEVRSQVFAIGRDASGTRTGLAVLGEDQARPSAGFGTSSEVRFVAVERGRIAVESIGRWRTVECGEHTTTTRSEVRLVDGAFDLTQTTERLEGACIQ